jgi:MFS family permease
MFALFAGCLLATLALVIWGSAAIDQAFVTIIVGYAVVGVLVATREPGNPIGWLLLVAALSLGLATTGTAYVEATEGPGEPLAALVSVQSVWLYVAIVLVPLLYPTGRLPTPRWRAAIWLGLAGLVILHVGELLQHGSLDLDIDEQVANPIGVDHPLVDLARILGEVVVFCSFVLSAVALGLRLRRSHGRERQQLKLFTYVVVMAVTILLLGLLTLLAGVDPPVWIDRLSTAAWISTLALVLIGMPIAIGVAILRHQLYDIDVVIKRTLVYGTLTAALLTTYLGSVLLLRLVLAPVAGDSDLAVAGSTLAVAALFRPARSRIQAVVDRRFYRSRYDAARTVESFAGRLREELDLEALGTDLRGVVRDTMQPAHVSLWLRSAT